MDLSFFEIGVLAALFGLVVGIHHAVKHLSNISFKLTLLVREKKISFVE